MHASMHPCNYVHMSMGEVFAWCHPLTDCRVRVNAKLNTAADAVCHVLNLVYHNPSPLAQAGWSFSLGAYNGLNSLGNQNRCNANKLHFYANNANQARLSTTLIGSGCARATFSDCSSLTPHPVSLSTASQ
jgi:hypothetical protein